jgi:hypothetical protein
MERRRPGFFRLWGLTLYSGVVYLLLKIAGKIKA